MGGLHKLHPTFVSFNSQVSLSPDEQTERSQIFSEHFSVQISEWVAYICVTHFVSHNVEYLIGCYMPRRANRALAKFVQIFFHPNFRVSFLHKLHPPLYLTKFRVSHSEFYKPRRANGALANFVSNIFRTNFRVGVLHKRHPICVSYNSHITLSTFGFL